MILIQDKILPQQKTIINNPPKVVLITGAGSGIGLALTKLLYTKTNLRIIASARPLALKNLSTQGYTDNERLRLRPLDILSSNSRRIVIKEIESLWGGIDILVNNAGISFRSSLEDMDTSEEELQMATNYFGPLGLIRELLPHMRAQHSGHIINVSSVGGMMAMPTMGSYSASKFALEGASEALWYELKPWGISVNLIQPGFINSNSFKKVYLSNKARSISDYDQYYKNMGGFINNLMLKALATPESVALKILKLIENGKGPLRGPATIDAHIFSLLRRTLPRELYHQILYRCLPNIKSWVNEDLPMQATPENSSAVISAKVANF